MRRLGALGTLLALCACGEGALESSTITNGVCTLESRLAILVTIINPDDLRIDSVTANLASAQHCFLERVRPERDEDDAGEPAGALYSCWEQGVGNYVVRVKSGKQTWTESIDVPGDDCHISKMQKLTLVLE